MRVVLDTNVIVAAFATRGLCADVLEVCISGHTLVVSAYILDEVREALLKKIKTPKGIVHEVIDYLRTTAEVVTPAEIESSVCRDMTDLPIVGTAAKGGASCIVTGDADLLALKSHRGIDIMTPREFWESLR